MSYLENYGSLKLRSGAGGSWENGLCVMEAVAWLGGEEATDKPKCACDVLGAFAIAINDALDDKDRAALLPLALKMVGTYDDKHEGARAEFIAQEARSAFIDNHNNLILLMNLSLNSYQARSAVTYAVAAFKNSKSHSVKDLIPILEAAIDLGPNSGDSLDKYMPRIKELSEFADTVLAEA